MALDKKSATFSFGQGIDKKTDPYQIPFGKLLSLENAVFNQSKSLIKRNGNSRITSLPDPSYTFLSTFSNDLIAIGDEFQSYSTANKSWTSHGQYYPCQLSVQSCIRTATNQTQCDSVTAPNGLTCITYTDQNISNFSQTVFYYSVFDSVSGVTVIQPTQITDADAVYGTPKVYLLSSWFVILYTSQTAGTYKIKYFGVSINQPSTVSTAAVLAPDYEKQSNVAFDGVVFNNSLYVAWTHSGVQIAYITNQLAVSSTVTVDGAHNGQFFTLQTQQVPLSLNYIWIAYYDRSTLNAYAAAVDPNLNSILAPTQILNGYGNIVNLTSIYINATLYIYYEQQSDYNYPNAPNTNLISKLSITNAGVVVPPTSVASSVGLASKAFLVSQFNSTYVTYFLVSYQSTYQSTYFLMTDSGQVIAKFSYQNGCGYLNRSLPNVTVQDQTIYISYLYKFSISSVNKSQNAPSGGQNSGVYAQQGINLIKFNLSPSNVISAELGKNLLITGGYLWSYDGSILAEQNFHLWPDLDINTTNSVNGTSNAITLSATTGGFITSNQSYYYIGVYEWQDAQGNLHRSGVSIQTTYNKQDFTTYTFTVTAANASGGAVYTNNNQTFRVSATIVSGTTLVCTGTGAPGASGTLTKTSGVGDATITFSSVATNSPTSTNVFQIYFPNLRLTAKQANSIKLTLYRASDHQTTFYQVTSITAPILNSKNNDRATISDSLADSSIVGNPILYTTGGVVENTGGQPCNSLDVYDNRLFMILSENPNVLAFSQLVIDQVPVEMSLLLTRYISPTVGSEGSTGPTKTIAIMDDKQVMFKHQAMVYINGTGPNGTGNDSNYSEPIFVTSTVGCDNDNSIIYTPMGLLFQASNNQGIWLLTRDLSTKYVGSDVETYNGETVLSANAIPGTTYVIFTMSSGITLMYDYYYNQWGTFTGIFSVSSTVYQGLYTYIDNTGAVFQQNNNSYLDGSRPILMKVQTGWINLAGIQGLQRAWWLFLLATYQSPHILYVTIAYDYNPNPSQGFSISPLNSTSLYGSDPTYGDSDAYGGTISQLEQFRINIKQQKCQSFQITFQEIYNPLPGIPAGPGLTLSAATLIFGQKKGYPRVRAAASVG